MEYPKFQTGIFGRMESAPGVPVLQCSGVPECSGVPVFRCSGVQCSSVPVFQCSSVPDFSTCQLSLTPIDAMRSTRIPLDDIFRFVAHTGGSD